MTTSSRAGRWGKGQPRGPKGRIEETRARVLTVVADAGPVTTRQVAATTGYAVHWVSRILVDLHTEGRVVRAEQPQSTGRGRRYVWTSNPSNQTG